MTAQDLKITVSGIAGSGKSYALNLIIDCLESNGYKLGPIDLEKLKWPSEHEEITVKRPLSRADLTKA
jgi:nucleoside-triphosphatase THEP1